MLRAESVRTPFSPQLFAQRERSNGEGCGLHELRRSHSGWVVGGCSFERTPPSSSPRKAPPSVPSSWLAPILPTLKLPKEWVEMGDIGLGLPLGTSVLDLCCFLKGGYTDNQRSPLTGLREVSPRATENWHSVLEPHCLQCTTNSYFFIKPVIILQLAN